MAAKPAEHAGHQEPTEHQAHAEHASALPECHSTQEEDESAAPSERSLLTSTTDDCCSWTAEPSQPAVAVTAKALDSSTVAATHDARRVHSSASTASHQGTTAVPPDPPRPPLYTLHSTLLI